MENIRLTDLPRALEEVKSRGSVLGKVTIEVTDEPPVQDWSTVVNKGALYQQVYGADFVLSFQYHLLTRLVGYRDGTTLLWSDPIYNRRDAGDEFEQAPGAAQDALLVFPGSTTDPGEQTGIPLLLLAVMLKGAMKYAHWLQQIFPTLSALQFTAANADPIFKEQVSQYELTGMKKEELAKARQHGGGRSGDYKPTNRVPVSTAPNTLGSGRRTFTGQWYSDLATAGYSVAIVRRLSHGSHGFGYIGRRPFRCRRGYQGLR